MSEAAEQSVIRDVLANVPNFVLSGYRPHFRTSKFDGHLTEEGNRLAGSLRQ